MPGIRKFFPTRRTGARWGVVISAGLGVLGICALALSWLGENGAAGRNALVLIVTPLLTAGVFALIGRDVPVRATPEGVFATRGAGIRSQLVRWHEIKQVVAMSRNGLPMLKLIHDNPFPEEMHMLMHLDDVSELRDFVANHAGEQHPLTLWLDQVDESAD